MKSTATIYDQQERVYKLLYANAIRQMSQIDPATGGSLHLAHNWGNEKAQQYLQQYQRRCEILTALFTKYYRRAFKYEYPAHLSNQ